MNNYMERRLLHKCIKRQRESGTGSGKEADIGRTGV